MKRKILVTLLLIVFTVLIILNIANLNYNDLSFTENKGSYLGLISNGLLLASMIITRKDLNKKEE